MKRLLPLLGLAAAVAISAQTTPKATTTPAKTPAKSATATTAKTGASASTATPGYKLPADEKRIPGIPRIAFSLKYQEIKVGTGPAVEPGKLWHVKYKGWRAADGVVFDNWEDHKQPLRDKDGKPEMDADGKPKMGEPEPLVFPQGAGRLIPGFDHGVDGMRVGGKRRIFIPWQMAYGTRDIPDRPDHAGIPAKSDLIFDVELIEATDMPAMPQRPGMMPQRPGAPGAPGAPGQPKPEAPATPPSGAPAAPNGQPAPPDTAKPNPPATPPNPGTPPPTPQPQPK
ncbi:MAG TPA: FKBP-type peptidyl-prolyl cis-trans isomerase [Terracidiphilus sp.]|jgi:peptidylprolyl isomerase